MGVPGRAWSAPPWPPCGCREKERFSNRGETLPRVANPPLDEVEDGHHHHHAHDEGHHELVDVLLAGGGLVARVAAVQLQLRLHARVDGTAHRPVGALEPDATQQQVVNGQRQGSLAGLGLQASIEGVEIGGGRLTHYAATLTSGEVVVVRRQYGLEVGLPIQVGRGHVAFVITGG